MFGKYRYSLFCRLAAVLMGAVISFTSVDFTAFAPATAHAEERTEEITEEIVSGEEIIEETASEEIIVEETVGESEEILYDAGLDADVYAVFSDVSVENESELTFAEFMEMLDMAILLADSSKSSDWERTCEKECPIAHTSDAGITRFEAMLAILYAAMVLGSEYAEFSDNGTLRSSNETTLNTPSGNLWAQVKHSELSNLFPNMNADFTAEMRGDTFENEKDWISGNAQYGPWSFQTVAYNYGFGRKSIKNNKILFDIDEANHTIYPMNPLTKSDAVNALSRFIDSVNASPHNNISGKPVTSLSLSESSLTLTAGQSKELTATLSPNDAAWKGCLWNSSNEQVAVVRPDGTVAALSAGNAVITVKPLYGTGSASCTVTVTNTPIMDAIADMTWGVNVAEPYMIDMEWKQDSKMAYYDHAPFDLALFDWTGGFSMMHRDGMPYNDPIEVSADLPDYDASGYKSPWIKFINLGIVSPVGGQKYKFNLNNCRLVLNNGTTEYLNSLNGEHEITTDPTNYGSGWYNGFLNVEVINPSTKYNGATFYATFTLTEAAFDPSRSKTDYFYNYLRGPYDLHRMIDIYLAQGMNVIRLNTSWWPFVDNDHGYKIDEVWLERIKEDVDYILSKDAYCIITTNFDYHRTSLVYDSTLSGWRWETSWMDDRYKAKVDERFTATWRQIAEYFKGYDEKLIFETFNEPIAGHGNDSLDEYKRQQKRIDELQQIFVNIVRGTGGKNTSRYLNLSVAGYTTYPYLPYIVLPNDPAATDGINRYMVQVHSYDAMEAKDFVNYVNPGDVAGHRARTDEVFAYIDNFTKKHPGVPVIMAEASVSHTHRNDSDYVDAVRYFFGEAQKRNVPCLWWEDFAHYDETAPVSRTMLSYWLYDKENDQWLGREHILDAIIETLGLGDKVKTSFNLSWDMNGHGGPAPAAINVNNRGTRLVTKPLNPYEEGWTFGGWYTDAACSDGKKWNFDKNKVDGDMTLYAKWESLIPGYIPVASVVLDNTSLALKVGETCRLAATVSPQDATDGSVRWDSEDGGIAGVDESGLVTAKKAGSTRIFVVTNDGNMKAWCNVTVTADPAHDGGDEGDGTDPPVPADPAETESPDDKEDSYYKHPEGSKRAFSSIGAKINPVKPKVYDGSAYMPSVKVTANVGGKTVTLVEGPDYRVLYEYNINAYSGEKPGKVIVKGNGMYEGEITADLKITPKPLSKLKVIAGGMAKGSSDEVPVYVYDGGKQLLCGTDYTLSPSDGLSDSAGKKTVTVTGRGNYTGTKTAKVTVFDSDKIITSAKLQYTEASYTGKALKPAVEVKCGSTVLEKKYYSVKYANNKNAGTSFVTVTGRKGYAGSIVVKFDITPVNKEFSLKKSIPDKTYNRKLQKPKVTVICDGRTLKAGRDYYIMYAENLHAGDKAELTVKGKGNYSATPLKTFYFTIKPQKIGKAALKGTKDKLMMSYAGAELLVDTDYEQPVFGEEKKNKVLVTIRGKGDFYGSEVTKKVKIK